MDSQRRDFSPILRGESLAEDTPVFVLDEYGPTRMIRARTWKYVHRYPDGPNELYNLADDPFETRNLVDRPTAKPSSSSSDDKRETLDSQRRDFSPAPKGESLAEDTPVFVLDEYGPTRMIRARTWKYVHRYLDGPNELYNLANDPFETRNLVDSPDRQTLVAELRTELETWYDRYVDPRVDGAKNNITGRGQIGIAGSDDFPKPFADDVAFFHDR